MELETIGRVLTEATIENLGDFLEVQCGSRQVAVYEAVHLTLQGRHSSVDAMEVPDEVPVRIGQIPLEMLDLVVDLQGRRLTGNPAHGGEHVLELY